MDMKVLLTKAACALADSQRLMTLDKVAHEVGIDRDQVGQALDMLASRDLIDKRSLEEFDEECYQANEATKTFCEKYSELESKGGEDAVATQEKPVPSPEKADKKAKSAKKGKPSPTEDPVQSFLVEHGAPKEVVESYEKVLKDKDRYKRTAQIWEKHIKDMVNNVTRDLTS